MLDNCGHLVAVDPSLENYLNDHGDFTPNRHSIGENSQLLCFNPKFKEWRNPQSHGTLPEPRTYHTTAIIGDNVWMCAGFSLTSGVFYDNVYQLNMVSLTWTEIQTGKLKPSHRLRCSLNALTEHQLLLHGGISTSHSPSGTWIFDLASLSWKKHVASNAPTRENHTGTTGLNSSVVIIGGGECFVNRSQQQQVYNDVITFRLAPRSLQQVATWTIYQHRDVLPWKLLPNQLNARLMFPVVDAYE